LVSKISLLIAILAWLVAIAGSIHCSFVSDEIRDPLRTIMTPATMCSLTYFLATGAVASIAFIMALIGFIFEEKSKVVFVSLILSGIISIPISALLIRQAFI
jgi:hypothetical protein